MIDLDIYLKIENLHLPGWKKVWVAGSTARPPIFNMTQGWHSYYDLALDKTYLYNDQYIKGRVRSGGEYRVYLKLPWI